MLHFLKYYFQGYIQNCSTNQAQCALDVAETQENTVEEHESARDVPEGTIFFLPNVTPNVLTPYFLNYF